MTQDRWATTANCLQYDQINESSLYPINNNGIKKAWIWVSIRSSTVIA